MSPFDYQGRGNQEVKLADQSIECVDSDPEAVQTAISIQ